MHQYIPNTDAQKKAMLADIGVADIESLFASIPSEVRQKGDINLPAAMPEMDVIRHIKSLANNFYFKINGWMPLTNELIAIEAKLNDWKRGLIQANRYKVFANKVYLAIPSTIQHRIDRNAFRRHGIGLISLNVEQNKKTVLVAAPNKRPTNKSKNNLAIEHFWHRNSLCA